MVSTSLMVRPTKERYGPVSHFGWAGGATVFGATAFKLDELVGGEALPSLEIGGGAALGGSVFAMGSLAKANRKIISHSLPIVHPLLDANRSAKALPLWPPAIADVHG